MSSLGKKEKRTRHSLGFTDEKSSDEKVETPQCDPAGGVELGPSSSSGKLKSALLNYYSLVAY